jgi:hypothetical protein
MDATHPGFEEQKGAPDPDERRHEMCARTFLSRYHLPIPRLKGSLARLGRSLEERPSARGDVEQRAWDQIVYLRRTAVAGNEIAALEGAETLDLQFAAEDTEFAKRVRLHCNEILRDTQERLLPEPSAGEAAFDRLIQRGWAVVRGWAKRDFAGLLSGLLTVATAYRCRGDAAATNSDRDYRKAAYLATDIDHLIHAFGRRRAPRFVQLFFYENAFLSCRLALARREPDGAKPHLNFLRHLAAELDLDWMRLAVSRETAAYLVQLSYFAGPAVRYRHLRAAEEYLGEAEQLSQRLSPNSPYMLLVNGYRRLELLYALGQWRQFDELLAQYLHGCRRYPHLFHWARARRLCPERIRPEQRIRPTYVAAGLASLLLEDQLVRL